MGELKDWIPLFTEIVWPLFILVFIALFRRQISQTLRVIADAVKAGRSVKIGDWLKIEALGNENKAIGKELDLIKDDINMEKQKDNPDLESLEALNDRLRTLEVQKEELEREVRAASPTVPLSSIEGGPPVSDVAIVIGHKRSSPGARNAKLSITEFDYNKELSMLIDKELNQVGIRTALVYRKTYSELPDDVNLLNPRVAISLHCNAFNGRASGSEVLYFHTSESGKELGEYILTRVVHTLGLPNRGVKPSTSEDRGGFFLRYVNCTAVIVAPLFIDNDSDASIGVEKKVELARSIALGTKEYMDGQPRKWESLS